MQENSTPLGCCAWLLVQHGCAFFLHLLQCVIDIVDFETDMMQTFSTLPQKFQQVGIFRSRFDQFDLATTRTTQRQKSNPYLLADYLSYLARCNTQGVAIKCERLLDIAHNNGYVIDTSGHIMLLR